MIFFIFFATGEREKEKLQYFASPERREHLYQYNQKGVYTEAFLNNIRFIDGLACTIVLAIIYPFLSSVTFHGSVVT
jgi:hypothetical protein